MIDILSSDGESMTTARRSSGVPCQERKEIASAAVRYQYELFCASKPRPMRMAKGSGRELTWNID